jgi:hypothetical protein
MTITPDQQQALQQNWEQARQQLQVHYPDLQSQGIDLNEYSPDLAQRIAQATNQGASEVESRFGQVAQDLQNQQAAGGQQGNVQAGQQQDQGATPHTQQPNEADQNPPVR